MLGHTPRELDRLDRQGALYRDFTRALFVEAGLRPGMRVLDLGSGSGDVAFLAHDLVAPVGAPGPTGRSGGAGAGPRGEVVGVERDPSTVEAARARAAAKGYDRVRFVVGGLGDSVDAASVDAGSLEAAPVDAGSVDAGSADAAPVDAAPVDAGPLDAAPFDTAPFDAAPFDAAPFDAVVGRFILMHQTDPAAVLRAALAHAKPGAAVAFVESSMTSLTEGVHSRPFSPLYDRIVRWKSAVVGGSGADLEAGLRLRRVFLDAGLSEPVVRFHAHVEGGADSPWYAYIQESVTSMLPRALELGIEGFDAESAATLADDLRAETVASGGVLVGWPVVTARARTT